MPPSVQAGNFNSSHFYTVGSATYLSWANIFWPFPLCSFSVLVQIISPTGRGRLLRDPALWNIRHDDRM